MQARRGDMQGGPMPAAPPLCTPPVLPAIAPPNHARPCCSQRSQLSCRLSCLLCSLGQAHTVRLHLHDHLKGEGKLGAITLSQLRARERARVVREKGVLSVSVDVAWGGRSMVGCCWMGRVGRPRKGGAHSFVRVWDQNG